MRGASRGDVPINDGNNMATASDGDPSGAANHPGSDLNMEHFSGSSASAITRICEMIQNSVLYIEVQMPDNVLDESRALVQALCEASEDNGVKCRVILLEQDGPTGMTPPQRERMIRALSASKVNILRVVQDSPPTTAVFCFDRIYAVQTSTIEDKWEGVVIYNAEMTASLRDGIISSWNRSKDDTQSTITVPASPGLRVEPKDSLSQVNFVGASSSTPTPPVVAGAGGMSEDDLKRILDAKVEQAIEPLLEKIKALSGGARDRAETEWDAPTLRPWVPPELPMPVVDITHSADIKVPTDFGQAGKDLKESLSTLTNPIDRMRAFSKFKKHGFRPVVKSLGPNGNAIGTFVIEQGHHGALFYAAEDERKRPLIDLRKAEFHYPPEWEQPIQLLDGLMLRYAFWDQKGWKGSYCDDQDDDSVRLMTGLSLHVYDNSESQAKALRENFEVAEEVPKKRCRIELERFVRALEVCFEYEVTPVTLGEVRRKLTLICHRAAVDDRSFEKSLDTVTDMLDGFVKKYGTWNAEVQERVRIMSDSLVAAAALLKDQSEDWEVSASRKKKGDQKNFTQSKIKPKFDRKRLDEFNQRAGKTLAWCPDFHKKRWM